MNIELYIDGKPWPHATGTLTIESVDLYRYEVSFKTLQSEPITYQDPDQWPAPIDFAVFHFGRRVAYAYEFRFMVKEFWQEKISESDMRVDLWMNEVSPAMKAARACSKIVYNFKRLQEVWAAWSKTQIPGAHTWKLFNGYDPHTPQARCEACDMVACTLCHLDYLDWTDCPVTTKGSTQ